MFLKCTRWACRRFIPCQRFPGAVSPTRCEGCSTDVSRSAKTRPSRTALTCLSSPHTSFGSSESWLSFALCAMSMMMSGSSVTMASLPICPKP